VSTLHAFKDMKRHEMYTAEALLRENNIASPGRIKIFGAPRQ